MGDFAGHPFQTSSCPGAKCVPYEEGHDALDRAIEQTDRHLVEAEKAAREMAVATPDRITQHVPDYNKSRGYGKGCATKEIHFDRPADFDPKKDYSDDAWWKANAGKHGEDYDKINKLLAAQKPHKEYAEALGKIRAERHSIVSQIKATKVYLSQRRAAWKGPKK